MRRLKTVGFKLSYVAYADVGTETVKLSGVELSQTDRVSSNSTTQSWVALAEAKAPEVVRVSV